MTDSFGLSEPNHEDLESASDSLIAAGKGDRWNSGGNSLFARRARVADQRRDKKGRWAWEGGAISWDALLDDGSVGTFIGVYLGADPTPGYMRVLVTDASQGIPVGVHRVKGRAATAAKAIIPGQALEEAGVDLDINGNKVGSTLDSDLERVSDNFLGEPDEIDNKIVAEGLTDEEKAVGEANRNAAPKFKSYNVVDDKGVRIDSDADHQDPFPGEVADGKFNDEQLAWAKRNLPEYFPAKGFFADGTSDNEVLSGIKGLQKRIKNKKDGLGRAEDNLEDLNRWLQYAESEKYVRGMMDEDEAKAFLERKFAPIVGYELPASEAPVAEGVAGEVSPLPSIRRVGEMLDEARAGKNPPEGKEGLPANLDRDADVERGLPAAPAGTDYRGSFEAWVKTKIEGDLAKVAEARAALDPEKDADKIEKLDAFEEKLNGDLARFAPPAEVRGRRPDTFELPEFATSEDEVLNDPAVQKRVKDAINNLRQAKKDALRVLAKSALAGDAKKFELNYAIAERATWALNEVVENYRNGNAAEASFFSGSEASRLGSIRLIQSSIKTKEGTDPLLPPGQRVVTEALAISIGKDGKPLLLEWKNGIGVNAYPLENGVRGERLGYISMTTDISRGGNHPDAHERDKPHPLSVGMIKTQSAAQNKGVAGQMVIMARWAAEASGRLFEHSSNLLTPGNMYSKLVSMRVEYHDRTQRDKFLFERYGRMENPLFQAISEAGWIGSTWKNPLAKTTQAAGSNPSPLHNKLGFPILAFAGKMRDKFHGDANAVPGVDYPAFLEAHVTGEKEDWSNFDIQTIVLKSIFRGGPTKEEVLAKLDELSTQLRRYLQSARGQEVLDGQDRLRTMLAQASVDMAQLREKLADKDFAGKYDEHAAFDFNNVGYFQSPFIGGDNQITTFKVPEGVPPVEVTPAFRARGVRPEGAPTSWTEDPATLAANFGFDELASALKNAVEAKDGEATLNFNGTDAKVQTGAIFRAIKNQGQDADALLAGIYDAVNGNNDNAEMLATRRAGMRVMSDEIQAIAEQFGSDIVGPARFDEIGGAYAPVQRILFADNIRRRDVPDVEAGTNVRLEPLNGNNLPIFYANNRKSLDSDKYEPQRTSADWVETGKTDDPRLIARNFSRTAMVNAFMDAIRNGNATVTLKFPNNATLDVPLKAIRDALQYQGVDTNALITSPELAEFVTRSRRDVSSLDTEQTDSHVISRYALGSANANQVVSVRIRRGDENAVGEVVSVQLNDTDNPGTTSIGSITRGKNGKFKVSYTNPANPSAEAVEREYDSLGEAAGNLRQAMIEDLFTNDSGFRALSRIQGYNFVADYKMNVVEEVELPESGVARRRTFRNSNPMFSGYITADEMVDGNIVYRAHRLDVDGTTQSKRLGSLEVDNSDPLGNGQILYSAVLPENSIAASRSVVDRERAVEYLQYAVSRNASLTTLLGTDEGIEEARGRIVNAALADNRAEIANLAVAKTGKKVTSTGLAVLGDGRVGTLRATFNGDNPPRYRQFEAKFELASFEIAGPNNAGMITARIYRSRNSVWKLVIDDVETGRTLVSRNFSPIGTKLDALDALKAELVSKFGLKPDDVQRMFPAGNVVLRNEPEAEAKEKADKVATPAVPAILDPNALRQPDEMPVGQERMEKVLDRVAEQQVELPFDFLGVVTGRQKQELDELARRSGLKIKKISGGFSGAFTVELPDGRVVKIKSYGKHNELGVADPVDQERFIRNEALATHIFDVLGIQASTGGVGITPEGRMVIAELIEPNIVPTPEDLNAPEFEQARKDIAGHRVASMFMGLFDIVQNQSNTIFRNDNGVVRAVVVDAGNGLIHRGFPQELRDNEHFTEKSPLDFAKEWFGQEFIDNLDNGNLDAPIMINGVRTSVGEINNIVRDKIVQFSPNMIREMVSAEITNPDDRKRISDGLISRRSEMLIMFDVTDPYIEQILNNDNVPSGNVSEPSAPAPAGPSVPNVPSGGDGGDGGGSGSGPREIKEFITTDGNGVTKTIKALHWADNHVTFQDENGVHLGEMKPRANGDIVIRMEPYMNDNPQVAVFDASNPVHLLGARRLASAMVHGAMIGRTAVTGDLVREFAMPGEQKNWTQIDDQFFDKLKEDNGLRIGPTSGFSETTIANEVSRAHAREILDATKMSASKRAKYEALLNEPGLLNGELTQFVREWGDMPEQDALAPQPIDVLPPQASDNEDPAPSDGEGRIVIKASRLRVGDNIVGSGRVVFLTKDPNGDLRIGLIDADTKKLKVINIGPNDNLMLIVERGLPETAVPVNNPVANFLGQGNNTVEDVKRAYPSHVVLPNGDLLLGSRDYTERSRERRTFRFEVVVHRTGTEEFVAYARRYQIDPATGQKIPGTESEAGRLTAPAHSSQALLNRIPQLFAGDGPGKGINGTNPMNWLSNSGDKQVEVVDPRTGMMLHPALLPNQNVNLIANTGIPKTGDGVKDALIGYIATLVDRGQAVDQIVEKLRQNGVFDNNQIMDIVERIESHRRSPINSVPYVSRDKQTILRVGDKVGHYDAFGNFLKNGTVVSRLPLQVYVKRQGVYEYRDIVMVRFENGKTYQIASRRLNVTERADGQPVRPVGQIEVPDFGAPEFEEANGRRNNPTPDGVQPPAPNVEPPAPNVDRIPNYDMLGLGNRRNVALELQRVLSPDLQVNLDDDPELAKVVVRSANRFVGAIRQLENGQYKAYYNDENAAVNEENFDNLQDAIDFMKNGIGREFPNRANNEAPVPNAPVVVGDGPLGERELAGILVTVRRAPNGNIIFYHDGNEVGRIEPLGNGKFAAINVFNGDVTEYNDYDMADDAVANDIVAAVNARLIGQYDDSTTTNNVGRDLAAITAAQIEAILNDKGRRVNYVLSRTLDNGIQYHKTDGNGNAIQGEAEGSVFIAADGKLTINMWRDGVRVSTEEFNGNPLDAVRSMIDKVNTELDARGVPLVEGEDAGPRSPQFGEQVDVGIEGYVDDIGVSVNWIAPPGYKNLSSIERRRRGKPYGFYRKGPDADGIHMADVIGADGIQRNAVFRSKEEARNWILDQIRRDLPAQPVVEAVPQDANPLTDDAIVARLPQGFEVAKINNFEIYRNLDDKANPYGYIKREGGEFQVDFWNTKRDRDNLGRSNPQESRKFNNKREAQEYLLALVNGRAQGQAPAGQPGQAPAPVNAPAPIQMPSDYKEESALRGRAIEILPADEDAPDAGQKPYGFLQNIGGQWRAQYWQNMQSYLDGNDADEMQEFPDADAGRQFIIGKINDELEARRGPQPGQLPDGFVNLPIGSGDNEFEIKNEVDVANNPYILVEKGADGRWTASKWDTGESAKQKRYRRPDASESFDTKEEAEIWSADQIGGGLGNLSGVEILERDQAVLAADGGKPTARMRQVLELKKAFLGGFTDAGRRGNGINQTRKVTLSDGTVAWLKISSGRVGGEINDVIREIASARMFEAVGLGENLIITEVIDPVSGKRAVLFKNFEADGHGRDVGSTRAVGMENAREIALQDFLVHNTDRHGGNWLYRGNTAIPIDNGISHNNTSANTTLDKVKAGRDTQAHRSPFGKLITDWANGRNQLFTLEEFETIADRVRGLRQMYVDMGMETYFDNTIIKRLDVLLGIARNQ
jgi:hypothetical protein